MEADTLKEILPNCKRPEDWAQALSDVMPQYGIETPVQVAAFLSQVGHESGHLNTLVENLNYGTNGLLTTFKKYFASETVAAQYARNPEKIANRVYALRMGNGDEASGDGWKYRGRGILQVTGRNNYAACSQKLFGDDRLLDNPDLLLEPEHAVASALWYWESRNIADYSDDIVKVTKLVNGGTHGIEDRTDIYEKALGSLA
jgi:putative chitinase